MPEPAITLLDPPPQAVFQRRFPEERTFESVEAALLAGNRRITLRFRCELPAPVNATLQVLPCDGASGRAGEEVELTFNGEGIAGHTPQIRAGGWYFARVKAGWSDGSKTTLDLGKFGVGDVFVIAGQSYSGNASEALLQIDDPLERVAAFDYRKDGWVTAHDPMPNRTDPPMLRGAVRGSVWPACFNELLPLARVPIGLLQFTHVATVREWSGDVLDEFARAIAKLDGVRAVLWAQGENDLIEGTDGDEYESQLVNLKTTLGKTIGAKKPWLVARSTIHPCVIEKPLSQNPIRRAQLAVIGRDGFLPGPDTDCLGPSFRQGLDQSGHFSIQGQKLAGRLWSNAIWNTLYAPLIAQFADRAAAV